MDDEFFEEELVALGREQLLVSTKILTMHGISYYIKSEIDDIDAEFWIIKIELSDIRQYDLIKAEIKAELNKSE